VSFSNGEYKVFDPSFDNRPTGKLAGCGKTEFNPHPYS
jgi:hypothetical protein